MKMKDDYFKNRAYEMDRFFKIKDFFCTSEKCVFVCTTGQKQACLEHYRMLSLGPDRLEDILI